MKYSPATVEHVCENNLLSKKTLNRMLKKQEKKGDSTCKNSRFSEYFGRDQARFPGRFKQAELVEGRYSKLPVWPEPPVNSQLPVPAKGCNESLPEPGSLVPAEVCKGGFGQNTWGQYVWIDLKNEGQGDGSVGKDGFVRGPNNTYNLNDFIHFQLTEAEASSEAAQFFGLQPGDYAVLVGMHVTSREIPRWTWQTFWWTPNPDNPHFPSSKEIAGARPDQLTGAPRHYALAAAYSMVNSPQPSNVQEGGSNIGESIYAYNPYLESGFTFSTLLGSEPTGTNNVGIQTNCMSCHIQARYFDRESQPSNHFYYTGDRYIGLDDPDFYGSLQVDFLWSIPDTAQ